MSNILYKKMPIKSLFLLLFLVSCAHETRIDKNVSLMNLGQAAYERQDYENAVTYFKQSLNANPSIEAYEGLANSFEAIRNWMEAAKIWAALSRSNNEPDKKLDSYKLNAAKNYTRIGMTREANELIDKITDETLNSSRDMYLIKGLVATLEGNETAALKAFNKILDMKSDDLAAQTNIALTYLVFNQPEKALKILESMPEDHITFLNKALTLVFIGRHEEGLAYALKAQNDRDAENTIKYAQQLVNSSEKERAYLLFGIE